MSKIKNIINNLEKEKILLQNKPTPNNKIENLFKNINNINKAITCLKNTSNNKNNNLKNFKIIKVEGNGACFYNALGKSLIPSLTSIQVKNKIIDFVLTYTKIINYSNDSTNSNMSNNNIMNITLKKSYNLNIRNLLIQTAINILSTNTSINSKKLENNILYLQQGLINHKKVKDEDIKKIIINDINNTWGGAHLMLLVSCVFNVTIMYYNNALKLFEEVKSDTVTSKDIIYLYYNGRDHYDMLKKK